MAELNGQQFADTAQQKAILRNRATARKVRAKFGSGTQIVHRDSGVKGVVIRHVPGTNAQGGYLRVKWNSGVEARVNPINVDVDRP